MAKNNNRRNEQAPLKTVPRPFSRCMRDRDCSGPEWNDKGNRLRERERERKVRGMDKDERFVNQKVGPLTRCDVRKTAARGDNTKARYAFATFAMLGARV